MSLTIWSDDILHLAVIEVLPASDRIFFAHTRVALALTCFVHASWGTGFHYRNLSPLCFVSVNIVHSLCLRAHSMHHAKFTRASSRVVGTQA